MDVICSVNFFTALNGTFSLPRGAIEAQSVKYRLCKKYNILPNFRPEISNLSRVIHLQTKHMDIGLNDKTT